MRKWLSKYGWLLFGGLIALGAQAQPTQSPDFINIKVPQLRYSLPDSLVLDSVAEADRSYYFQPRREPALVEATEEEAPLLTYGELYPGVIEISEQLRIDCVWVKLTEYYQVWDSYRINPYDFNPYNFKDTIAMPLYDTLRGETWAMPLIDTSRVTSNFGLRHYRWHYGIDLKLQTGDTVVAAFDGIVRIRRYDRRGYGYYVVVRHANGLETLYGHLSKIMVRVGDVLQAGEPLGLGGSTGRSSGPHLHYEVRYQGVALDPRDVYDFDNWTLRGANLPLAPRHFSYLTDARKVYFHRVRRGDTLSGISRRYGVSIRTLCRLNGISTRSVIRVGQRLRIR